MLSAGFAFANLKYYFTKSKDYEQTQLVARETNKGIWGDSKNDTIINEQEKTETRLFHDIEPKAYFVCILVLILLLIGIYTYIR